MAVAKRIKAWKDKITPGKQYPVEEGLKLVKEFATAKFPEAVERARRESKAMGDVARTLIQAGMKLVFGSDNGSAGRGFGSRASTASSPPRPGA